jgi:hypothetical protein
MTRHILDHSAADENVSELKRFTDLERKKGVKGPHPSTASLQQRPHEHASDSARMRAFMKIERENQ